MSWWDDNTNEQWDIEVEVISPTLIYTKPYYSSILDFHKAMYDNFHFRPCNRVSWKISELIIEGNKDGTLVMWVWKDEQWEENFIFRFQLNEPEREKINPYWAFRGSSN